MLASSYQGFRGHCHIKQQPLLTANLRRNFQYLQDKHIRKSEVGKRPVDRAEQCRVIDLGSDACKTEDGESPVVALVLEVVGVPPYKRHSQVRQGHLRSTRLASIPGTAAICLKLMTQHTRHIKQTPKSETVTTAQRMYS